MSNSVQFIGGPLDGQTLTAAQLNGANQYTDIGTGSVYYRIAGNGFSYSHTGKPIPGNSLALIGPLPEVTVHGSKLMTLGQLAQFLDAARQAGYPEDHVPRVVNSFSGRIRALTAKDKRRADHTE